MCTAWLSCQRKFDDVPEWRVWCALITVGEKAMSRFTLLSAGVVLVLFAAQVRAGLVDFNDQPRGKIITSQFFGKYGLTISADNFTAGHPDKAIIFDSNNHSTK